MSIDQTEPVDTPWQQVVDDLRRQLAEAEEILQAIVHHKVDAFIINGPEEEQVYTLRGADHAYQVILEAINEGAATLGVMVPSITVIPLLQRYCKSRWRN